MSVEIVLSIDPLNVVYIAFFGILFWRSGIGGLMWRASFGPNRMYYRAYFVPNSPDSDQADAMIVELQ